jgi:hypothetical protein
MKHVFKTAQVNNVKRQGALTVAWNYVRSFESNLHHPVFRSISNIKYLRVSTTSLWFIALSTFVWYQYIHISQNNLKYHHI